MKFSIWFQSVQSKIYSKIFYWQTIWSQNEPFCIGSNLLEALLSSICVDQIWRRFNFHHFMMIIDPIEILENCDCKTLFYFQIYHEFYWNLEFIVAYFKCTGYSSWDWLRDFIHKFTWIVLSVHKLNKLGKFGKFMDNCWISCQDMADMENTYNNLIIINL